MKVFKTCFFITRHNRATIFIYLIIFALLAMVLGNFGSTDPSATFAESRPSFSVISRDEDSAYIQSFLDYLSTKGNYVPLEDSPEVLQDSLFLKNTSCVLILPDGFVASLFTAAPLKLEILSFEDSSEGYYLTTLADLYWNLVQKYTALFPDLPTGQQLEYVSADLSCSVKVQNVSDSTSRSLPDNYLSYYSIASYFQMTIIMLCISNVFLAFKKPDLVMRNLSSPLKPARLHLYISAFGFLFSLFCWVLITVSGLLVYNPIGKGIDIRLVVFISLNSLANGLVSFGLSMFFSSFVHMPSAQGILGNFIPLLFNFLGGNLVSLNLLNKHLLNLSRFTPTYWHIQALNKITNLTDFTAASLQPIISCIAFQLLFVAAFLAASLAVYQAQSKAREDYGTIKTNFY